MINNELYINTGCISFNFNVHIKSIVTCHITTGFIRIMCLGDLRDEHFFSDKAILLEMKNKCR